MKAADLRKSILQAAVQGKLVPQDKNDEPASEILKRVQAKKAAFIRTSKLKNENPLPPILEDDTPYDLPEGWVWCRLGDLGNVQSSKRVFTSEFVENGIPFYRGTEIGALSNGEMLVTKYFISENHYHDLILHTGKPIVGDLLMPSICPDGRIWLVDTNNPFYFKDGRVLWVRLIRNFFNNQYIQLALKSRLLSNYSNIASGTTFAELKIFSLKAVDIPLPPLSEQYRIVAKIDELMALCDELETAEKEQDALERHLAENLPKSILQAAVQGKLVLQDKSDEPACELLKQVQAEKIVLIKAGKLKKENPLPPIAEEEIPCDLPEGWVWCRLGDFIFESIGGGTPSKQNPDFWNGDISWASVKDLNCEIIDKTQDHITELGLRDSASNLIQPNSIIVCMRMGLGKIAINKIPLAINQDLRALTIPSDKVLMSYFIYWYKTLNILGGGMTVKGIKISELYSMCFPLPPLAEQQRIVAKVDEMLALCDELKYAYNRPIPFENVIIPSITKTNDTDEEPLQMAAQGKVNVQPSPKHADALKQLQGMMQDE